MSTSHSSRSAAPQPQPQPQSQPQADPQVRSASMLAPRPDPGVMLLVAGLIGLAAAFTLMVEKVNLLQNPDYVPTCSVNALLSCTGVMTSAQASAFGFPNPLLGIVGFCVLAATGAGVLAGALLRPWYWIGLQLGLSAGFVFVHWLISASLFTIGALCPYCMLVWVVTAAAFWFTTVRNVRAWAAARPTSRPLTALARGISSFWLVPLTLWYLVVVCAVVLTFRVDIVVVLAT